MYIVNGKCCGHTYSVTYSLMHYSLAYNIQHAFKSCGTVFALEGIVFASTSPHT